jgi:hypothetical protein
VPKGEQIRCTFGEAIEGSFEQDVRGGAPDDIIDAHFFDNKDDAKTAWSKSWPQRTQGSENVLVVT